MRRVTPAEIKPGIIQWCDVLLKNSQCIKGGLDSVVSSDADESQVKSFVTLLELHSETAAASKQLK